MRGDTLTLCRGAYRLQELGDRHLLQEKTFHARTDKFLKLTILVFRSRIPFFRDTGLLPLRRCQVPSFEVDTT